MVEIKNNPALLGVLNGANLGRLPRRSHENYGADSWENIESRLRDHAQLRGWNLIAYQSNSEGCLIDWIEQNSGKLQGCVINPGAYMIHGYALADAIEESSLPWVEVHMSRIFQRESKRHVSVIAPYCAGQIIGFASLSYDLALEALMQIVSVKS